MENSTNNAETKSSFNQSDYDALAKKAHNIELQIKIAQYEAPKKIASLNLIASIAIIGGLICFITCLFVMINSVVAGLVLLSCSIILVIISFSLFALVSKTEKKIANLQKQLDGLLFVDMQSIKFYRECSKMVTEGNKITDVLPIIGQKYGYSSLSSAQTFYKKGEQEIEKQKIIKAYKNEKANKDKQSELHIKEQTKAREESDKKNKVGKEKYLVELRKWIDLIESQKQVAKNMHTLSSCNAQYKAKTKNWGIAGGVGSALGGVGVGMAAAMNTQVKNEQEKIIEKEKHELARTQSNIAYDLEYGATTEENKAFKYLQAMEETLIDEQNINVKFKLLEFSNISISLSKGNNLLVKFKLKCLAQPTILSKPAIFDGTLKLSIYNKENEIVSTGYYVANGYGKYNYRSAGFKMEDEIAIICPINSKVVINELRCEITPESLWFIEKNKRIFNVNNTTITNGYESLQQTYRNKAMDIILNMD